MTINKKEVTYKGWWVQMKHFARTYTSLTVIIIAALMLELTTGILFYTSQKSIQHGMEQLVETEMNAIFLCIRNRLVKIEVTLDNMAWVVQRDLENPNWMMDSPRKLVENNPDVQGCGIAFAPYYYPQKGRWYEPVSSRMPDSTIVSRQVGSAQHDYTKAEFYTVPMTTGKSHWSEPYMDKDGTKEDVTTYSAPVHTMEGKIVGVVLADVSLDWLQEIMEEHKIYNSTQRFLTTGKFKPLAGADTPELRKAISIIRKKNTECGYFTMDDNQGNKKHVFYTPIGGETDWILIHILQDSEVFGKLRKTRFFLLLPVMIGLIFVGIIVYRSSRNLDRLRKANAEKDRIRGELRVASQIQQSMLPSQNIHQDVVHICGSLEPAREVGGDLYDYFIRDEKLFFCIGDVSGKGAPSAMLMAVCHALFRSASAHENNPAIIMQSINEVACLGNESNMFVTMFVGVLDLLTGRLRYCDAGHDAPFILDNGKWTMAEVVPHLPVGVFDDTKYGVQETTLQPDSTIFLYTDGLTEAMNAERKQFGLKRLQPVLDASMNLDPENILEQTSKAVSSFVKKAEQSDDLTMLIIRYTPQQFESTLTETLVIKNDLHEVTRFGNFMKATTEKLGIEPSLARQLRLAVEEAVVNVIDYAYPTDTQGYITIHVLSDGDTIRFQIIDAGGAFDPTTKKNADITLSAEERQIGGLGILLVRELMDTINYERTDGKNVLTLIKKLKTKNI